MGSIGVQTGSGRITNEQIAQLSESQGLLREQLNEANSIVVFPDRTTTYDKIKENEKKWRDILGIDNGTLGFGIAMTNATSAQKQNFLATYNSMKNLKQYNDKAYDNFINRQLNIARTWARSNGRNLSPAETRLVREMANTAYQRQVIDRMIANDTNGSRFGGNIMTRRLTKRDYEAHEWNKRRGH